MTPLSTIQSASIGHEAACAANQHSCALYQEVARARENHWFRARDRELLAQLRATLPATSRPVASRSFEPEDKSGVTVHPLTEIPCHSFEDLWFHLKDQEILETMRKPGSNK